VEFHLAAGDLIRLLRANGFEILDLIELYAPEDATEHVEYSYVPVAWARRWPSEEIWRARKRD
ncbi:MAG: SAM-dependent methyltransferase, partial [Chloroflexota bacterium]